MRSAAFVELEVSAHRRFGLRDRVVGLEADLFALHGVPLDEHVVVPGVLLSMLMRMLWRSSNPVTASLVNWLSWPVLKMSGVRWRWMASSTASMQKSVSVVIDARWASTFRAYQSMTAVSYMKPRRMGI